jgi:hypothetical protein
MRGERGQWAGLVLQALLTLTGDRAGACGRPGGAYDGEARRGLGHDVPAPSFLRATAPALLPCGGPVRLRVKAGTTIRRDLRLQTRRTRGRSPGSRELRPFLAGRCRSCTLGVPGSGRRTAGHPSATLSPSALPGPPDKANAAKPMRPPQCARSDGRSDRGVRGNRVTVPLRSRHAGVPRSPSTNESDLVHGFAEHLRGGRAGRVSLLADVLALAEVRSRRDRSGPELSQIHDPSFHLLSRTAV